MQNEVFLFKVLADPTRLRLAVLLAVQGETCVCRLAEALQAPEYGISRHLSVMRSSGLVKTRRQGTWIFYRLAKPSTALERSMQECLRHCFKGHATTRQDVRRLRRSVCRPQS